MDNLLRNAFGSKDSVEDGRISTALLRTDRRQKSMTKKTIYIEKDDMGARALSRTDATPSLNQEQKKHFPPASVFELTPMTPLDVHGKDTAFSEQHKLQDEPTVRLPDVDP